MHDKGQCSSTDFQPEFILYADVSGIPITLMARRILGHPIWVLSFLVSYEIISIPTT